MGLKGAPAYFQRSLATIVLVGLIYIICELYKDDILVYASTEDEFIQNLTKIFERFIAYNITLNPKKCKFGLEEALFVGHTINKDGIKFSDDKIQKVLDFTLPLTHKQLKSFIGLANYFRDHISHMSDKQRPLLNLIDGYSKNKKLQWNEQAKNAFNTIKQDIANCPSLYFVDDFAPIIVQTDASDYGMGAYIFQKKDEIEHPIIFISKAFSKQQLNWSTTT